MRRTGTTRRGALTATGAIAMGAVLAGCGGGAEDGGGGRKGSAHADARTASAVKAETSLRKKAAGVSTSLLGQYENVLAAHPATAAGLTPLRDAVRAHVTALAPGGKASLEFVRTRPAGSPPEAVKALAAAERRASASYTEALMEAPPELARLLASVAAAASAHSYLLTGLAKETKA
uniref:Lipoprotein n=1 Tax=Streptomyces sp. NBC_00008 TaxID=2903610 RepID=A0AAU2VMR8_9ACTN